MATVQSLVNAAAIKYGVSPSLALAVAQQESGFNQGAVSGAGAIGVMQLMPATAAGLGVDPTNLEQNIDGGVRYLAQLLTQYNGNSSLALAAYNAGPGNVAKYGGIPPFSETQNYVASVLSIADTYSPQSPNLSDLTASFDSGSGVDITSIGDSLGSGITPFVILGVGALVAYFIAK